MYFVVIKSDSVDFEFLQQYHSCLDVIEKSEGACMMVTINRGNKTFCSGYNLITLVEKSSNMTLLPLTGLKLLGRILNLNVPTLCIANGHAVAMGLFIALCHDQLYLLDNPKTKYFLSESVRNMTLPPLYSIMLRELLPGQVARELLSGKMIKPEIAYNWHLC